MHEVGFDLPKMVPTMQALMRSNNQAMSNFQKLNGTAQSTFSGWEPSIDPGIFGNKFPVAIMYQQTIDPKCSKNIGNWKVRAG